MKQYKEGKDWEFIINEDEDATTVPIRILTGQFKDTVYTYGRVGFRQLEDEQVALEFMYNVIESPWPKIELERHDEFRNQLGDILVSIIEGNIERGLDETRTDYFEELDNE